MSPEQPARRSAPTRRGVLKGVGAGAFAAASLGVLPLFSTPDRTQNPNTCTTRDLSNVDHSLDVSNWPIYIDQDTKKRQSTMTDFEKRYGINVTYNEDVNDNVEFFGKVVNQLGSCQTTKRDLFVLTDWMAARMIKMGWIQKHDPGSVPNLDKNLLSSLRHVNWDPKREYSAPWQSGFAGIAYNKKLVKQEVRTVDELLTRSDLRGRVTLLAEMPDTMGLVLLSDGKDPSSFSNSDFEQGVEKVKKARDSGQIRAFTGNEYVNDLLAGNVLACFAWSGDVASYSNIEFVVPEEGMMIWSDNMLIPNLAAHKANAEKWINYYYEPAVAAQLAAYVNYVCPVEGAQQAMEKIDKSLVDNPLIFPTPDYLKQTHSFMGMTEPQVRLFEGEFNDVAGA
ncbi:MAG: spermidine/putrescine ABC transporter substrate-binding protein [Nocardioidaceae bacterium]|nr:spermidine/putrescine ABC transporter substrate-binding protein [Nocardioidaceae bacterium]MCL2612515.1 spermidine/putrescine ABC transporter substrate-binding protein [Nocardioidaceae bacterium]